MAAMQSDYRYTFETDTGLVFDVVHFRLDEGLSNPFLLQLEISGPGQSPADFSLLIDQGGTLTFWRDTQPVRYIHGIINRFEQGGSGFRRIRYSVSLVPAYARMALTSNCRIFQQQSVPDIIKRVLKDNGIIQSAFNLYHSHNPREYCVQYRETDQQFIERLAAEEGLYYYFTHNSGQHSLVFCDRSESAPSLGEVYYNPNRSGASTEPALWGFGYREQIATAEVQMRDYNFKNPGYNLEHRQLGNNLAHQQTSYKKYDYPGRYKADAQGKPYNQIRLEYERRDSEVAKAQSDHLHLLPGHRIQLSEKPQPQLQSSWCITRIHHEGQQPQSQGEEAAGSGGSNYGNRLHLIPTSQSWRALPNPRPRVDGPQIAHVVGPKGEEIYCDEHGRVKVQFPWDLEGQFNENASCWIRVSQGWAGTGWGAMAIPRIGQEVIVDFLEGDPDQPIITGRTYHTANVPPYDLPANKTRMSIKSKTHKGQGFNELRFEDEAGQEELFIHAQKDQNNIVRNDETTQVGSNRSEAVGNNEILKVGQHRQEQIGGTQQTVVNKDINIVSQSGNINLQTAGASITLTADGQIYINGKQVTVIGTQDIQLNPDGASERQGIQPLNLEMDMPQIPGQFQASKTNWPEDVPQAVDPAEPLVKSSPRQKSTFEKMEDWSRSAGQTNEAILEDMVGSSFDNLDQAKSRYNENDVAGASAAVGMAAVGMVDPTRKGMAVKKVVTGEKGKKVAKNKENGKPEITKTLQRPSSDVTVSAYRGKHAPRKGQSQADIAASTKSGPAKFYNNVDMNQMQKQAWDKGTPVSNGKPWKVFNAGQDIGAKSGKTTPYMRIESTPDGVIHGHPITSSEFLKLGGKL